MSHGPSVAVASRMVAAASVSASFVMRKGVLMDNSRVCFCPRRSFRADAGCLLSKEASPRLRLRPLPVDLSLLDLFGPGRSTGSQPATVRCHVTGKRSRPATVRCQSLSRWVPASGRNLRPSTSTPTTAFQPSSHSSSNISPSNFQHRKIPTRPPFMDFCVLTTAECVCLFRRDESFAAGAVTRWLDEMVG